MYSPDVEARGSRRSPGGRAVYVTLAACVCLAACALGVRAGKPFVEARRMRAENARLERRALEMKRENAALRKELTALDTQKGMEREARKVGYLAANELPLVIPRR